MWFMRPSIRTQEVLQGRCDILFACVHIFFIPNIYLFLLNIYAFFYNLNIRSKRRCCRGRVIYATYTGSLCVRHASTSSAASGAYLGAKAYMYIYMYTQIHTHKHTHTHTHTHTHNACVLHLDIWRRAVHNSANVREMHVPPQAFPPDVSTKNKKLQN
jgi:hypothetical protein